MSHLIGQAAQDLARFRIPMRGYEQYHGLAAMYCSPCSESP